MLEKNPKPTTYLVQVQGISAETEGAVGGGSDSRDAYKCKDKCEEFYLELSFVRIYKSTILLNPSLAGFFYHIDGNNRVYLKSRYAVVQSLVLTLNTDSLF